MPKDIPAAPFWSLTANDAEAARFLFRVESLSTEQALPILRIGVALFAPMAFFVRFSDKDEAVEKNAMEHALRERLSGAQPAPIPTSSPFSI